MSLLDHGELQPPEISEPASNETSPSQRKNRRCRTRLSSLPKAIDVAARRSPTAASSTGESRSESESTLQSAIDTAAATIAASRSLTAAASIGAAAASTTAVFMEGANKDIAYLNARCIQTPTDATSLAADATLKVACEKFDDVEQQLAASRKPTTPSSPMSPRTAAVNTELNRSLQSSDADHWDASPSEWPAPEDRAPMWFRVPQIKPCTRSESNDNLSHSDMALSSLVPGHAVSNKALAL